MIDTLNSYYSKERKYSKISAENIRASRRNFKPESIYNKEYKVVNSANSYTYNTQNILDIVGGENVSQNARLFVADYHNFRGKSPQEIGMSNQVSWGATTV